MMSESTEQPADEDGETRFHVDDDGIVYEAIYDEEHNEVDLSKRGTLLEKSDSDVDLDEVRDRVKHTFSAIDNNLAMGNVEARLMAVWEGLGGEFDEMKSYAEADDGFGGERDAE